MPNERGLFEILTDFSFNEFLTAKKIKALYTLALVVGAVVALFCIFRGMQISAAEGVLTLIVAAVSFILWAIFVRVLLEVVIMLLRIAENTAR